MSWPFHMLAGELYRCWGDKASQIYGLTSRQLVWKLLGYFIRKCEIPKQLSTMFHPKKIASKRSLQTESPEALFWSCNEGRISNIPWTCFRCSRDPHECLDANYGVSNSTIHLVFRWVRITEPPISTIDTCSTHVQNPVSLVWLSRFKLSQPGFLKCA